MQALPIALAFAARQSAPLRRLSPLCTAAGGLQNGVHPAAGGSDAGAACGRCRVMVMLQRLVARVHAAHAPRMPPPLALQLVGGLQV